MFKAFRDRFYTLPTPLAGLALGIASLGLGLENALPLHSIGQSFGALVALLLLLVICSKFMLHPGLLKEELGHPVLGSIMPTFAMALMLVSKSLSIWSPKAGEALWLIAILLHLVLLAVFVYYRLKAFKLHQMVPSWFVPFVGIILAAVTVPGPKYHSLAYGLMIFGMINYAVLLPVMVYRLMFSQEVADAAKPTIAIMAAPASLALVAYLSLEPHPSLLLCSVLLGLALLMTGVIYLAFFKLLRLPFSPAFASYTFPMAVSATALYKVSERLAASPATLEYAGQLGTLAVIEMIVASLIVTYVCLRYTLYYVRSWDLTIKASRAAKLRQTIPASPVQMLRSKQDENSSETAAKKKLTI